MLTTEGSPLTASMFRDIKAGQPIEADHVIGDLIARADTAKVPMPRLRTAYTHPKAYQRRATIAHTARTRQVVALPTDQDTQLCRSPSFDNRDFRAGPSFGSRL